MANFLKSLFVKGVEIDTAGAITGDVLKYDGSKFGAASAGGGSVVGVLDDLTDVVITTPATTQYVRYNGTNWVNQTISAGDVPTLNQNTTGSAATVTEAAQTAITSVGTLSSLAITGDLTVDTTTLKVDSTNNRVGIGTTTPSTALDVVGTTTLKTLKAGSGAVAISFAGYASPFSFYLTSTPHGFSTGDTVAVTGITPSSWNRTATITWLNPSAFFFSSFNGSTGGAYSSGGTATGPPSTFYVDTTNDRIGIGTPSPSEKLDVVGNIALTGSVVFEGATDNTFETTVSVTDPTADRTITLPNATGTVALITVSDTAPTAPATGSLWFKSDTGNLLVYYDSYWIDASAPAYSTLDGGTA